MSVGREVLVFGKTDGLRGSIFGDGKVFCREALNGVALLVFDYDGFDHELHFHREGEIAGSVGIAILAHLLRGCAGGEEKCESSPSGHL